MQLRMRRLLFLLLVFISLLPISGIANARFASLAVAPLPPRISINGYSSSYAVGQADLMLPLLADKSYNFYLNPSASYSKAGQDYLDLGLGYRWVRNLVGNEVPAVMGVYFFGGYSRIEHNARLWVANPGIEALGTRWDAHINAYFPVGDRNLKIYTLNTFGPPIPAPGTITFGGHSEFTGTLVSQQIITQHAGDGADIKLGYQLFSRVPLKGYLGAYFFIPSQVNNIWGGATGLEYWVERRMKIFASYTYDTLHRSTGALGIGLEFGGTHVNRSDPSVEERITDPTERYLAELGRGSGIPSRKGYQIEFVPGPGELLFNNIAFFSQTGGPNNGGLNLTIANCTFENPCGPSDLTNAATATLEALLPNTMMYFNGGSYSALDVPNGAAGVTLQPGQSISSFTPDYTQPAIGSGRSVFVGAFILTNNTALNNIIAIPSPFLASSSPGPTGVTTNNTTNFSITGSLIGRNGSAYGVGVGHSVIPGIDASSGSISNSQIFATNFGVVYGGQSLTIQNTMIDADGSALASGPSGVFIDTPNSLVNIMNSQISITGSPTGNANGGIFILTTGSTVTASNTIIDADVSSATATAIALSADGSGSIIQFNQGALALTGPAGATLNTRVALAGATITISPSTVCTSNGSSVVC